MTHSYDSTLLQRMGFRDQDRKTSEHDDAAIRLATSPTEMLRALGYTPSLDHCAVAMIEVPLQKGEGKFSTTVGFIDSVIEFMDQEPGVRCKNWNVNHAGVYSTSSIDFTRCGECFDHTLLTRKELLVEIKTKIDNVGDLLRQMNLYRQYKRCDRYAVWSLDRSDSRYGSLLLGQGYSLLTGPTMAAYRRHPEFATAG